MYRLIAIALFVLCTGIANPTSAQVAVTNSPDSIQWKQSEWKGFRRVDFTIDSRKCWIVKPKREAENRPWIWRARFFGHEPQADVALLDQGFHLAYCDVAGLFGNSQAIQLWDAFYDVATTRFGLSQRPALEGMSRGGLIIYNWAAANPDKVSCIYGDAPVCDFRSWPGGKGNGKGSPADWQRCLKAYGITEAEADDYQLTPINNLAPLAKANVPLLHVVGDADVVVPVAENTSIIESRYLEMGGEIKVIHKPGVGHHPHALKDPAPIVAFVLENCVPNVNLRSPLIESKLQFQREAKGHVAFIGGSITEMNGYRPMVCASLQQRFPDTEFKFTAAGISSTCSTTGAFRLDRDVLSHGPVDLFFIEFAVNDDQDAAHTYENSIRGLEGIIRQVKKHNPNVDIVLTYFVNPRMLKALQTGKTPLPIQAHNAVALHYGVSTIHLAKEIAEQCSTEQITWEQFGGTHPKPFGNRICADMIDRLLDEAWKDNQPTSSADRAALPDLLDTWSYENGRLIALEEAEYDEGWKIETPDWTSIPGSKRSRFTNIPLLCCSKPGAELTLEFTGSAVGVYVVAGPDAGKLQVSIDGADETTVNLFHRFSKGLHYPRTVLFANELEAGPHTVTLRLAEAAQDQTQAVRIINFVAN